VRRAYRRAPDRFGNAFDAFIGRSRDVGARSG
jgi:hypothetical protein